MKKDFEENNNENVSDENLVDIEDMTEKEFREYLQREFIREAEESKEELFADKDFEDYEQSDEEVEESYQKLVARLKEEGLYREEESGRERNSEVTGKEPGDKVISIEKAPHRKRKILAKAAGFALACGICITGLTLTSEAGRNYIINTFQVLTGNNMRTVVGNDQENENVNTDEYEAIAEIEEKLGVEVPEFYYRPYKLKFMDYLINDVCSTAWIEYQYSENIITLCIDKENQSTASAIKSMTGDESKIINTISLDNTKVQIEEVTEEGDSMPSYVARWGRKHVSYFIAGKIEEKEMEKIVKNLAY